MVNNVWAKLSQKAKRKQVWAVTTVTNNKGATD